MMKSWSIALGIVIAGYAAADDKSPVARHINLDEPGAMENLAQANLAHFSKVWAILREAPQLSAPSLAGWIRTRFAAQDVSLSPLLKTSLPPQTSLSFVLDDTRYSKVIYVDVMPVTTPAAPQK